MEMVELNEKALEAAVPCYSEGGCSGLDERERREVVTDIILAYLSALAAPDDGLVERQIRALLLSFVAEHFPENTGWRPLPNLLGMVSQLDNAITIARDYRAQIDRLSMQLEASALVGVELSSRLEAAEQQVQKLTVENGRLREALTPSADTKAAYMGEFYMGVTLSTPREEEYRRIQIPWDSIKEIMAAIRARSALETQEGGK